MNLPKKIKLYYAFKFFQNFHFFGAVLVPFYTVWAGMTEQTVLLIQSWFMISVTLLELPTGVIADKYGRKTSLILGAIAATIGLLLYGLYPNIYLFLIGEFILALAMSLISGADQAWIVDSLHQHQASKRKTEVLGKGQSFTLAGILLGSLVGSLIARTISLNATMFLSAIPAVILLYIALKLPEPRIHKTTKETFRWIKAFASLKVLLTDKNLRLLSINLVLVSVSAYFTIWLYQPLLQRVGIGIVWFGLIHSSFVGLEIILSHRFAWFEKKLGASNYLMLSAILTSIGFGLLLINVNVITILLFVFTTGSFGLSRKYFAMGHFHEFVEPTYRASITSSFSLLVRLSTAIANIFIGWLFVRSAPITFIVLGLLPILALVLFPTKKVFESDQ